MNEDGSGNKVDLAANLTIAWLSNPNVRANDDDATAFLQKIHSTLISLSGDSDRASSEEPVGEGEFTPAVSVRKSLASKDKIISLIDGKPYSSLKRHLATHGLTPAQYRERYGLKNDYPMVAPAYAEQRRALAKKIGLGRKRGAARPSVSNDKSPTRRGSAAKSGGTANRGRRPKKAAPAS